MTLAASMLASPATAMVYAQTLPADDETPVDEIPAAPTPAEETTEPETPAQPAPEDTVPPVEEPGQEPAPEEPETPAEQPEQPEEPAVPAEPVEPAAAEEPAEEPAAPEEETTAEPAAQPAADEPAVPEEEVQPEADSRPGTDIKVGLELDVRADGESKNILTYQQGKDRYDLQVGGTLDMSSVWSNYRTFKFMYTLKNGEAAFRSKNLTGNYEYIFTVNPEVVSVNTAILEDPNAWQQAFESGSGADAAGFFSFMKCTQVKYDAASGQVTVDFKIDENGTGMVKVSTIEDLAGSMPDQIRAYSPEGAFYIDSAHFKKGAEVMVGPESFTGTIDMSPWMALVFPIRFESNNTVTGMKLDVPDARVSFTVENGTWQDGSTDPISVFVPTEVVQIDGVWKAAGKLNPEQVPAGMKAAEGYDQDSGHWVPAMNTAENGVILAEGDNDSAIYVYQFEKKEEPKPEEPKPEQPKPEEPKPEEPKPEKPAPKPETQKPVKPAAKPEASNKKPSVQTGAGTGLAALLGLEGLSAAGLWAMLKKKKK